MAKDYRAKLQPIGKTNDAKELILGPNNSSNILQPLWKTNGLMFPYTPMIQVQHANVGYGQYDLAHTNYDYFAYQRTSSPSATVTGVFGAHTQEEAEYMMAAIHFLRVVTKSNFGASDPNKGTPPPKLAFSAYGDAMFNRTPVYVRTVAFGLDQDVDYVAVRQRTPQDGGISSGSAELDDMLKNSYVPLVLNLFIDIMVAPNPSQLRDEFNLEEFRTGKLLDKGYY
tara:strand:+ start:6529 stop:7206 length:678 start_codon:yes stop_codon:yes gene_type:complete